MSELQAVLLCGGGGSRMTDLTNHIQKCLLPVCGVPMFWFPLNTLARAGVKDVKLFIRENNLMEIKQLLTTPLFHFDGLSIETVPITLDQEEWGTAELIRHHTFRITKDFIVMSGDFISDASLIPMVDQFRAHQASFSCLLSENCATGPVPGQKGKKSKSRDLIALCESTNRMIFVASEEDFDQPVDAKQFLNKFPKVSLTARFNDCHVYFFRHALLPLLQKNKKLVSLKADFVPYILEQQCSSTCTETENLKCMSYILPLENGMVTAHANNIGAYFEICKSVIKSLPRMSTKLSLGRNLGFDRNTGISEVESFISEDDVQIKEKTTIKRSVIGSACKIGERCRIQNSVLMDGVSVGQGCNITQSIVMGKVVIEDNCEISNCIISLSAKQKIPAGSKLKDEVIEDEDEDEENWGANC